MPIKSKYLILIILINLLLPKTVAAFGFSDIFTFLDHLTESIEDIVQPIMGYLIKLLIIYALALFSLILSAHFLETYIVRQSEWLIKIEPMTEAGWSFISGLANMLVILILIFIAFAFIFKIETFKAKQILPQLIIVALLLNFSLLFVKMLVDISQIIFNTILKIGGERFVSTAVEPFIGGGLSILIGILAWAAVILAAWAIPLVHPFAQLAFLGLFLFFILPNIVIWIFQIFCFFTLSLMFVAFIFLFGARVFIIQILMILAPLAFLCLILPPTKNLWSKWFKILLEWLSLGIFFLFFLVLGFKAIGLLVPKILGIAAPIPFPGLSWFQIGGYIIYYFGILIYMAVVLGLGLKFMPTGAQGLIDFGKSLGSAIITRGLVPLRKVTGRQMARAIIEEEPRLRDTVKKIEETKFMGIGKMVGGLGGLMAKIPRLRDMVKKIEETKFMGIGKMVGGPGSLMAKITAADEKVEKKKKQQLALRSDGDLDGRLKQLENLSRGIKDLQEIKWIIEIRTARGTLQNNHAKFLAILNARGMLTPELLKEITTNRPDWAGVEKLSLIEIEKRIREVEKEETDPTKERWALGDREDIENRVIKLSSEQLAKDVQKEALANPIVYQSISPTNFNYLGVKASTAKKRAIKKMATESRCKVPKDFESEAKRRADQFLTNPNWQVGETESTGKTESKP